MRHDDEHPAEIWVVAGIVGLILAVPVIHLAAKVITYVIGGS